MSANASALATSVMRNACRAGSSLWVSASTAARCIAVGKTSLLDWLLFTSSLGCTKRPSPRGPLSNSLARLASTSFMFMLVWVPEPVCQTTRGNSSSCAPAITSSQAATMAVVRVASSKPRLWFTYALARLTWASARMSSGAMRSPEMAKCCKERWVCAPHKRRAGTSMGPKVSRSVR